MNRNIYIALLPLLIISFVSESAPYLLIPSLPDITSSLGLTRSEGSSLVAIYYLTLSVTFLFAGVISDRYSKRGLLMTASLSILTGSLLLGFGSSYTPLVAGRAFQALGAGMVVVVAQTWIGQNSSQRNITRLLSLLTVAMSFAPLVAPAIGGFINDMLGWRYNFYFVAVLSVFALVFLIFSSTPASSEYQPRKPFAIYKRLLFETPFFRIIATMLVCFLFQGSLTSYSSFLFIEQFGLSASSFGFISIPIVSGIIIGQFPVLWFEKKLGMRASYTFNSIVIIIALIASLIVEQSVYSLVVTLFVFNIGFGGHNLIATRSVITYFASECSYSSALINFMGDFSTCFASLFVQLLFLVVSTTTQIHTIVCSTTIILIAICYLYCRPKITDNSVLR